jgi:hypothetical protein
LALPLAASALLLLLLLRSWPGQRARGESEAAAEAAAEAPIPEREPAPSPRLPPLAVAPSDRAAPDPQAGVEPHPITPERLRLDEQHQLFDRVEAAVAARDFTRARGLLREHRARFSDPDAWTDLREGWEAIADCLERPGPVSHARAQRFVDEEPASSLRRRVRRTCLEPGD